MWRRDELVERIRQYALAEDATGDWPDATVLDIATMVHQQEWQHLIAKAPRLRLARRVVTVADEQAPWADLSTATERAQRVVLALSGVLSLAEMVRALRDGIRGLPCDRVGEQLMVEGGAGAVTVLVTHLPPLLRDLPLDTPDQPGGAPQAPVVPFPDGWEMILAYEGAAHLLHKGARESAEAAALEKKAEDQRQRMLDALGRDRTAPLVVQAADDPSDWGG